MSLPALPAEESASGDETVVPADDFNYYRDIIYWNSFERTISLWNETISGDANIFWVQYLKRKYGTFEQGLFLNCGNGWVERALFEAGVIKSAIGLDIGKSALEIANIEADKIGMPSEYINIDTNKFSAMQGRSIDLIVNHGAMHHVAYLNRVTRELRDALKQSGLYVLMDYVGPHRNQYPWNMWSQIVEFNETLPEEFRKKLEYAHMKTMIAMDPTEAIHSEIQVHILQRYFDIEEYIPLGGGIAYTILFENRALFRARHTPEGKATLERIFEEDRRLLTELPESNLFAFAIAKPKQKFDDAALVEMWQREENDREDRARIDGGRYYPINALEIIYNQIADMKHELSTGVHP